MYYVCSFCFVRVFSLYLQNFHVSLKYYLLQLIYELYSSRQTRQERSLPFNNDSSLDVNQLHNFNKFPP